jgi:hypothetical protein
MKLHSVHVLISFQMHSSQGVGIPWRKSRNYMPNTAVDISITATAIKDKNSLWTFEMTINSNNVSAPEKVGGLDSKWWCQYVMCFPPVDCLKGVDFFI